MNDEELLRYSRQILLPQIGVEGQQKLAAATVLIVGVGGLGSPLAMYLGAAGVGRLILADPDVVDISNLQRQIAFDERDLGRPKAEAAAARVRAINAGVHVVPVVRRLSGAELAERVKEATLVVDASDNIETRHAVNEASLAARKPLVSGAAIRLEGKVAVFRHDRPGMPCYACVFDGDRELGESCSDSGILGPVVGLIGSIQAMEAMRIILDLDDGLSGRLLVIDARRMAWYDLRVRKRSGCLCCGPGGPRPQPPERKSEGPACTPGGQCSLAHPTPRGELASKVTNDGRT